MSKDGLEISVSSPYPIFFPTPSRRQTKMQVSHPGKYTFLKDFKSQYKEYAFLKSDRLGFKYPALHLHNFSLSFSINKNKVFPIGLKALNIHYIILYILHTTCPV